MLIDEIKMILKAGDGGAGRVSFYPGRTSGPDGGDGGRGGDIYVVGVSDITALNQFAGKKQVAAENGEMGGRNRKFGSAGGDLVLYLPVGCELLDTDTKQLYLIDKLAEKVLICQGGLGGRGNYQFKSSRNTTPMYAQKGLSGEKKNFEINLKLIADIGLIGLPNAGKSSLLNELTAANPKIGSYPFTTLEPNLGVLKGKVIADIPGLIEGASSGRGLGIRFLKHIEKVNLLLHCLSSESENVVSDYQTVNNELKVFNKDLLKKKQIILLTKTDLVDEKLLKVKINQLKKFKKKTIPVSIHDLDSIQKLTEYF